MLTIFYDGQCPMCATEMRHLKRHDQNNLIHLVDLHQDDFDELYPQINYAEAINILHGEYQGEILLGLQVTHKAWTLVGKGHWVAALNWPLIKPLSARVYLVMAKHRQIISTLVAKLPGVNVERCSSGTCYMQAKNANPRQK